MTDMRGISREETDLLSLWTTALALTVGAIGGALIAARFARSKAGDEAPIRVKNGSIELQLLHPGRTFVRQGNTYRVDGGAPRDADEYALLIEATPGACPSFPSRGNHVRYTHRDSKWVQIHSNGRRTWVTSNVSLQLSPDGRLLTYPEAGHIVSIGVGGHERCTFPAAGHFQAVYMTEP